MKIKCPIRGIPIHKCSFCKWTIVGFVAYLIVLGLILLCR